MDGRRQVLADAEAAVLRHDEVVAVADGQLAQPAGAGQGQEGQAQGVDLVQALGDPVEVG